MQWLNYKFLWMKNKAESIIDELGMSPKTAITVFYKQIVKQGKIPFSIEFSKKVDKSIIFKD